MNGNKYSLFLRLSIKSGVNYLHFAHSFTNQSHQASIPVPFVADTSNSCKWWFYFQGIIPQRLHIRIQIRRQIDFVDQTDICLQEDMRIFQRLVIPFGGTDDNDFLRFSQIEHDRTNERHQNSTGVSFLPIMSFCRNLENSSDSDKNMFRLKIASVTFS